jgi:hypothetical protein
MNAGRLSQTSGWEALLSIIRVLFSIAMNGIEVPIMIYLRLSKQVYNLNPVNSYQNVGTSGLLYQRHMEHQ